MATVAIVAAVATEEPEIAENSAQLRIVAMPSPPGKWPTQDWTALNRSLPIPPLSRMFDISRKSGTASSTKLSAALYSACGTMTTLISLSQSSSRPSPPRAKATGTLINRSASREKRIRAVVICDQSVKRRRNIGIAANRPDQFDQGLDEQQAETDGNGQFGQPGRHGQHG